MNDSNPQTLDEILELERDRSESAFNVTKKYFMPELDDAADVGTASDAQAEWLRANTKPNFNIPEVPR